MPLRLEPTFRDRLADADRALIGMWLSTGSPLLAEICAGSGIDWLLIDMEHGPNTITTVQQQLQVIAAYRVPAIVRVPFNDPVVIKQVLDTGAQNVLVPMVASPEEARAAVAAVRYPPAGIRGVGSALARSGRWGRVERYVQDAAEHVSLFVQVESGAAVEAAAEIAAVDGVDGVLVGPADLAASMGLPGQQSHPEVLAAVRRVFEAVTDAGKKVGVNAFDPATADAYLADGAHFLSASADVTILARGSEALAARFIKRSGDTAAETY
ncbi:MULTISPECIES: HpcH/HpaI aldolase family protein [Microbacterium]|uniref:HpcH/HpaI aldolase family protein n=1 Tax=Microbacterium TaxID=33882 RepID=UPI00217D3CD1|nr:MULTISPECIES: HpcH/HpaI aldolase/citrate lyase family protein [Microbacterium]UWF77973.1 HpcH/HpaI aldolase/citrate lyase family protein [Microbacterium neungamense]WCM56150.1 HpcH/HpaI aldolase/citrate lyase family protein [Microbacterium sp. EF45047]